MAKAKAKTVKGRAKAKKPAPKAKAKAKAKAKKPAPTKKKAAATKRTTWPANEPYDRAVELLHSNPREASKLFKAAAKLQPKRPRIHINLAWALSKCGMHPEAIAAAERAYQIDPQDPYVAARRVHVLFAANDERTVEAARQALEVPALIDEDRRYARGAIAWTLMRTSPSAAVRETEAMVADMPNDGEALAAHGCALAALCRWDEGLPWLDKAIAAAPGDMRFAMRRDTIVQARDAATTAMQRLRADAEANPTDADAWRQLGLALAKFARLDEALVAFERARELEPDVVEGPVVVAALMVEATARTSVLIGDRAPIG